MAVTLFQFQNCAKKEFAFEDQLVSETMSYFEYRYDKATPIYFEVQVLPTTSDATFQSYDIMGFATPSDGVDTAIDWKVAVYDTNGNIQGTEKIGQLAAGNTLFTETFVIRKTVTIGTAVIKVKKATGGDWHVYTKKYNE
jgi:hypothetical protein